MTILVVVHNPDTRAEIAGVLARDWPAVACASVADPAFQAQFANASLLITDLVPPVLELLQVNARPILRSGPPVLILTSHGHSAAFAKMLSAPDAALAYEPGQAFLDRLRDVAAAMARRDAAAAAGAGAVMALATTKRVAVDRPHSPTPGDRSRKAVYRRDRLVSDIAHDLRTPLTAIYEFTHLMESGIAGPMTDQQQRYIGIISRRCHEAARMVDDLLDGAKLESGRMTFHRAALRLADVVADLRETVDPAIRHSGVQLADEIPDDMPRVFADRDMLGRILANLVSNAIKFSSPDHRVTIRAERQSVSTARVSVIDSGSGISPQELRRIFRRFEQGTNRVRGGVGLGLSIVRDLVRLHGGRVMAESTPGRGSRFHFTLPLFLPAAIVRDRLASLARGSTPATIWSFHCSDAAKYDAIHRLITATVRAEDLVVPDDAAKLILLITQTPEPRRLIERLTRQVEARGVAAPGVRQLGADEVTSCLEGQVALSRETTVLPPTTSLAG